MITNNATEVEEALEVDTQSILSNEIILYNDDVNTFDHVIETLMIVCQHEAIQAEQCALLVHYTGKCSVKTGSLEELIPQCSQLLDAGLSAEIQ